MSPFFTFTFAGLCSLLILLIVAMIVREVRARLKAGPVRFRLPLASLRKPPRAPRGSWIVLVICALISLPVVVKLGMDTISGVFPLFCLWVLALSRQIAEPRRDERRWLVLIAGLLGLATGALLVAFGERCLLTGRDVSGLPAWFFFLWSPTALVQGAWMILEFFSGTRVREGGVEVFARTLPWSWGIVKDWRESEGRLELCLTVPSTRPSGVAYGRDREIVVPVPASERPALEEFLGGRIAATALPVVQRG